jgi:magnesium transporter
LAEGLYFHTDELAESINALLSLHLSLASQRTNEASQRTNEVMRVLTIFSVFLLPLNVITGIYGMNFEHMPELKWAWGYPFALVTMCTVMMVVYLWFRKRGWLK